MSPVTVGIACYSEARWSLLIETIASVQAQDHPAEIVVSVDHNPALYQRLVQHAQEKGADAVIGMRYDATEFTQGVTEVLAYGTAVKLSRG